MILLVQNNGDGGACQCFLQQTRCESHIRPGGANFFSIWVGDQDIVQQSCYHRQRRQTHCAPKERPMGKRRACRRLAYGGSSVITFEDRHDQASTHTSCSPSVAVRGMRAVAEWSERERGSSLLLMAATVASSTASRALPLKSRQYTSAQIHVCHVARGGQAHRRREPIHSCLLLYRDPPI